MDRFSKYNPKAAFLFFIVVFVLNLAVFHPLYLSLSVAAGLSYKIKLNGRKVFLYFLKFILPLILFVSVFNFVFSHYGDTVLFAIKDTAFTFESMFYGFCQGLMVGGVIIWFSIYSQVVTSEKFLSVFGGLMPSTALIFSAVLSFIPRLKYNYEQVRDARMLVDHNKNKLKKSVEIFSAVVTMTLEDSINLSDSMRTRGYNAGRKVYSKYRFNVKDLIVMIFSLFVCGMICTLKATEKIYFIYEPVIETEKINIFPLAMYILFLFLPLIIDLAEDMRWRILKQKI